MLGGMHSSWPDVMRDRFESYRYVTNKNALDLAKLLTSDEQPRSH
jgi:hypothetical protein